MKRGLPAAIVCLLSLGLAACGDGGGPSQLACDQQRMVDEVEHGQLGRELLNSGSPLFSGSEIPKTLPKRLIGCADLDGDDLDEMVVQVLGPTASAATPWAILRQENGDWRVAVLRPDISAAKVQIQGERIMERTPAYASNDPYCCPSGQRNGLVKWNGQAFVFEPEHPPPTREIVFSGTQPISIGGLDFASGSLPQAIQVFGVPSFYSDLDASCPADWLDIGLRVVFANFGGADPCGPHGRVSRATVHLSEGEQVGWQTNLGLKLGDQQERLIQLYPRNRPAPHYYTENNDTAPRGEPFILLEHPSPIGAGSKVATLLGYLDFGKVTALEALPFAAGD